MLWTAVSKPGRLKGNRHTFTTRAEWMIEQARTLPVTRKEAFAFLLDAGRWRQWTPFAVRGEETTLAEPGVRVSLQYRTFRIPVAGSATLDALETDASFSLTVRLPGSLPVGLNVELIGTGTRGVVARVTAEFDVPGGQLARSLWSMSPAPIVVRRELDHALDRAHDLLAGPLLSQ